MTVLTIDEKIRLSHLEERIDRGVKATIDMAQALLEIRTHELYRQAHPSFEAYCQERWGIGDRYARQLVAYAQAVGHLDLSGATAPTERALRPIAALPPDQQTEAWHAAQSIAPQGELPTSAQTARAAHAVKAPPASLQPGQTVTVLDEASPYYGQSVIVEAVQGVIVDAQTPQGKTLALLTTEITPEPPKSPAVTSSKPQTGVELLSARLSVAEARIDYLEALLRSGVELLQSRRDLSPAEDRWIKEVWGDWASAY